MNRYDGLGFFSDLLLYFGNIYSKVLRMYINKYGRGSCSAYGLGGRYEIRPIPIPRKKRVVDSCKEINSKWNAMILEDETSDNEGTSENDDEEKSCSTWNSKIFIYIMPKT